MKVEKVFKDDQDIRWNVSVTLFISDLVSPSFIWRVDVSYKLFGKRIWVPLITADKLRSLDIPVEQRFDYTKKLIKEAIPLAWVNEVQSIIVEQLQKPIIDRSI